MYILDRIITNSTASIKVCLQIACEIAVSLWQTVVSAYIALPTLIIQLLQINCPFAPTKLNSASNPPYLKVISFMSLLEVSNCCISNISSTVAGQM